METNAYLMFKGQCREAFEFYAKVFGTKIDMMMTHGEIPPGEPQVAPEWRDKIVHTHMTVGSTALMGSDSPPEHYEQPKGFWVSIGVDQPGEAERIYKALSDKGTVRMPMQETFWAHRFAMFFDRFGIPWMVNCGKHE